MFSFIQHIKKSIGKGAAWFILFSALTPAVMARQTGAPQQSSISDPLVLMMVIIMLILLLAIGLLAYVVLGAAAVYRERQKEKDKSASGAIAKVLSVTGLLFASAPLLAQDATSAVTTSSRFGSLSPTAFYFMLGVVALELIVLFVLLFYLRQFLLKEKAQQASASGEAIEYKPHPWKSLWERFNKLRPVEQEAQIDLGHNYDGIRELDNRLPPWWLYGFYISILFAVIYLWRYHVSETAPLSGEEYRIAVVKAEAQQAEYLKKAANKVDETNVKYLTDATAIDAGKSLFDKKCAACHGKAGEGVVGPNLTDNYWLHGGSINDIFKTIKYGVPEKGMQSWKEDMSPSQMAQVASYIKNLHGTNPPNPKEKQGELYQEAAGSTGNDSTGVSASTTASVTQ